MPAVPDPSTTFGNSLPGVRKDGDEMTTQAATRAIACPNCGAQYKLRTDFSGNVKCKKCQKVFSVGMSQAERKGVRSRDRNDQKTAVKMIVICGVALLLIAGIVVMAGNTDSGTSQQRPTRRSARRGDTPLPSNYQRTNLDNIVDTQLATSHPPTIAAKFVRAMAEGDTDTIKDLFLFDQYFERADKNVRREEEKYHNMSDAEKAAKREMVLSELTDAYLTEVLKTHLIPQLEADEEWVWASKEADATSGGVRLRARDDRGKDLILVDVELVLRPGLKGRDAEKLGSWGVKKVSRKFLQKTLASDKADKRMVDIGQGTDWKKTIRAGKSKGKGPPEADPVSQEPVPGTSDAQKSTLLGHIRALIDPATSGPDFHKARDALTAAGKYAIPFMLNELLERDHAESESDILASNTIISVLRDMTGQSFGYRPGRATGLGQSQVTGTPEERTTGVRRWFGWWRLNQRTWNGKKAVEEDEDDLDDDK